MDRLNGRLDMAEDKSELGWHRTGEARSKRGAGQMYKAKGKSHTRPPGRLGRLSAPATARWGRRVVCTPKKMVGGYCGTSFTTRAIGNDEILKLNIKGPDLVPQNRL